MVLMLMSLVSGLVIILGKLMCFIFFVKGMVGCSVSLLGNWFSRWVIGLIGVGLVRLV